MSKLPAEHKFLDLSDYGRPPARWIARGLKNTSITPIHVTMMFVVAGCIAVVCIVNQQMWAAAFFLILKSVLDAADGELARVKKTPSYIGRYFDSVADIILNFVFLYTICHVTRGSLALMLLAFCSIQLQGTLYNYYYVILRNKFEGDTTSRVFEDRPPVAMPGEQQAAVDTWFWMYHVCYSLFDRTIYHMDKSATQGDHFPKWFMTAVSGFGLGFQLLIMAVMLCAGWAEYIIPFFIAYSAFILLFIMLRRNLGSRKPGHCFGDGV